jgi:hypothetical protein
VIKSTVGHDPFDFVLNFEDTIKMNEWTMPLVIHGLIYLFWLFSPRGG